MVIKIMLRFWFFKKSGFLLNFKSWIFQGENVFSIFNFFKTKMT